MWGEEERKNTAQKADRLEVQGEEKERKPEGKENIMSFVSN